VRKCDRLNLVLGGADMLSDKRGTSIISLTLCLIVVIMIGTAVFIATSNSARYKVEQIINNKISPEESLANHKTYTHHEVTSIARQAFVNNYLAWYDGKVDLENFRALVIGEMMQTIPVDQLEKFDIHVTQDGVTVN